MKRGTSLYLDVGRFTAALNLVLGAATVVGAAAGNPRGPHGRSGDKFRDFVSVSAGDLQEMEIATGERVDYRSTTVQLFSS
jgi:hypothetical protein